MAGSLIPHGHKRKLFSEAVEAGVCSMAHLLAVEVSVSLSNINGTMYLLCAMRGSELTGSHPAIREFDWMGNIPLCDDMNLFISWLDTAFMEFMMDTRVGTTGKGNVDGLFSVLEHNAMTAYKMMRRRA